jgi:KDO2-lipid IV(A) lauroyltransferase
MARLGLALIWLLHFLPPALLARVGAALGTLLFALARARRRVVLTNLRLCFPELADDARRRLARAHFRVFARSLVDHGILWWGSQHDVQALVRVEGLEHWRSVTDAPVILLAPHFVAMDMGGIRLTCEGHPMSSIYSRQKSEALDAIMLRGRSRFGRATLFARQAGIRPMIRSLNKGEAFYYLPDMDLGERDSVFAPFFGVQAATITGLSRISGLARAIIVPCVTRQLPGGGYVAKLYPAWRDFPSGDLVADAQRMNAFIEARVREMPEQYYWLHKRFKTRPAGEQNPYA